MTTDDSSTSSRWYEYKDKREFENYVSKVHRGNVNTFRSGPFGVGDPGDQSLSKTEINYALPLKRQEMILETFCPEVEEAFTVCRQLHPFTKWFNCSNVTKARTSCVDKYWDTPGLEEKARDEYLRDRTLYRSTGMKKHEREKNERDPLTLLFGLIKMRAYDEYATMKDKGIVESLKYVDKIYPSTGETNEKSNFKNDAYNLGSNGDEQH